MSGDLDAAQRIHSEIEGEVRGKKSAFDDLQRRWGGGKTTTVAGGTTTTMWGGAR